jgi:hypothetical protein
MPLEVVLCSVKILFPSGHNFNINSCNIIIKLAKIGNKTHNSIKTTTFFLIESMQH